MKNKETLEEFTKEVLEDVFFTNISEYKKAEKLIEIGAKWQQERMIAMLKVEDQEVERGVTITHVGKQETLEEAIDIISKEEEKCVNGCKYYYGGEIRHHKSCHYYSESFSKMYDDLQEKQERMIDMLKEFIHAFDEENLHLYQQEKLEEAKKLIK